jgi:hypothetical protein
MLLMRGSSELSKVFSLAMYTQQGWLSTIVALLSATFLSVTLETSVEHYCDFEQIEENKGANQIHVAVTTADLAQHTQDRFLQNFLTDRS